MCVPREDVLALFNGLNNHNPHVAISEFLPPHLAQLAQLPFMLFLSPTLFTILPQLQHETMLPTHRYLFVVALLFDSTAESLFSFTNLLCKSLILNEVILSIKETSLYHIPIAIITLIRSYTLVHAPYNWTAGLRPSSLPYRVKIASMP